MPILVTELGIETDVRLLQPENADAPMWVTEFGMSILERLLQFWKALLLITVTESGIIIDVRLSWPEQIPGGIILTLLPKTKLVMLVQP